MFVDGAVVEDLFRIADRGVGIPARRAKLILRVSTQPPLKMVPPSGTETSAASCPFGIIVGGHSTGKSAGSRTSLRPASRLPSRSSSIAPSKLANLFEASLKIAFEIQLQMPF
jgi:hypothetical protein